MHIRWKKRTLQTNRQNGLPLCPHDRVKRPKTLTPVLTLYEDRRYRSVWRPGRSIRQCCLDRDNGLAFAAWWAEVDHRFKDLESMGIEDESELLVREILEEQETIEGLLENVVPYPTAQERREHQRFLRDHRQPRPKPICIKLLGLAWPCTLDDVKTVWKKLALEHHPDRGGDPQAFMRYKKAYDKALVLVAT